jgi:uncharacterized membrane protein
MRILVSIFLLILFGCKSTTTKINEVSFQTVSKGVLFGDGVEGISESNISFTNAKDWKSFLEKINTPNTFSKVTIDFSEQQLLCVFDTIRNTSGYKIEIKNILIENKGIKIIYTSAKPSAKEMVNMVITQPYHLVIINKRAEEVTFIHKDNL